MGDLLPARSRAKPMVWGLRVKPSEVQMLLVLRVKDIKSRVRIVILLVLLTSGGLITIQYQPV